MGYKKCATCFVTLLKNKLKSDVAHFTTHFQTCLEQQIRLQGLFSWVIKSTTSLFNSFCSKVAKQVAHFLLPILPYRNYQCAWCPVHVHVYLTYRLRHHSNIRTEVVGNRGHVGLYRWHACEVDSSSTLQACWR